MIEDDQIITKFATISNFQKNASLVGAFQSASESISNRVSGSIKENGAALAIGKYMTGGAFATIFPFPFGLLVGGLAEYFGVNLDAILGKAGSMVSQQLQSGKLTKETAKQIATESVSSISATASLDYFHQIEKKGQISAFVRLGSADIKDAVDKLPKKGKLSLLKGLIRWGIAAIIMGFVIKEGAGIVGDVMKSQKGGYDLPTPRQHSLKPSGQGVKQFENTESKLWIVNLTASIEETVKGWAIKIYPELKDHADKILSSPSFIKLVSILKDFYDPNYPNILIMPYNSSLHSWKDVVDLFAGDVASQIGTK